MGMKVALSFKEFEREFKSKVTKPVVDTLKGAAKNAEEGAFDALIHAMENELPTQLYGWITHAETTMRPGDEKLLGVYQKFLNLVRGLGYGRVAGFLTPLVQRAVMIIYRSYFEEWFDENGLEDDLETFVGFKVGTPPKTGSSGGGSAGATAKPATAGASG